MRRLLTSLLVLAALTLPRATQAQPRQVVSLATLAPSALLWVHLVAESQGFYARQNLTVRELRASDSPALLQAVSSGSATAGLSLGDLAIRAIDRGAPIIIVGAVLDHAILRLMAPADVPDIPSLNGQAVTAGAVRGGTADLLRYIVKQGGGDPTSLKMVSIANSRDRIVALENKQIRAALLLAPFDTIAEREGFHALGVYREPYVETPLILNRKWAAENPATGRALVTALRQAAQWMNNPANRDGTIDALAVATSTDRALCAASYDFIIADLHAIPPDLAVTQAGLENIAKIDTELNGTGTGVPFKLDTYYDRSFDAPR